MSRSSVRSSAVAALRALLILLVGMIAAAHTADVFLQKFGYRGDSERFGLVQMVDKTAHRPFVYRQLAPFLIRKAEKAVLPRLSDSARAKLDTDRDFRSRVRLKRAWTQELSFIFHAAHVLNWLGYLGFYLALIVWLSRGLGLDLVAAVPAAALSVIALPLSFIQGGYLYDSMELAIWTMTLAVAVCGRVWLTLGLCALMALNKESALVAMPALFPLLVGKLGWRRATVVTSAAIIICGVNFILVRQMFQGNLGSNMEYWLPANVHFWTKPSSYIKFGELMGPGILLPEGANLLYVAGVLPVLAMGWVRAPFNLRSSAVVVGLPTFALFLTSCYTDELRNLSLVFPHVIAIAVLGTTEVLRGGVRLPSTANLDAPATSSTVT